MNIGWLFNMNITSENLYPFEPSKPESKGSTSKAKLPSPISPKPIESVAYKQKPQTTVYQDFRQVIEELEEMTTHIEKRMKKLESLNLESPPTLQTFMQKFSAPLIERITESLKRKPPKSTGKKGQKLPYSSTRPFMDTLEGIDFILGNRFYLNQTLGVVGPSTKKAGAALEVTSFAAMALGPLSILMMMNHLIKEAKKTVKMKKKALATVKQADKASLEQEIDLLQKWISTNQKVMNDQLRKRAAAVSLSASKAAASMAELISHASPAVEPLGIVAGGASLGIAGWNWYRAHKNLKSFNRWAATFHPNFNASQVLETQRKIFEKRCEDNLPALIAFLNPILDELARAQNAPAEQQKKAVVSALDKLQKIDCNFEEFASCQSSLDLHKALSTPAIQKRINERLVKEKETVSVSLRNALKTLATRKASIERKFFKFALNKEKALFGIAALDIAALVTLKVLVVVGVITGTVALSATGYGLLAAGVILGLVGLAYLYYKKPNTFKSYFSLVYLKSTFGNLRIAINHFKRHRAYLKLSQSSGKDNNLRERVLKLDAKVSKLEAKMKEVEQILSEAGWKDYQRHLLKKSKRKAPASDEDASITLARSLLSDNTLLEDTETAKILKSLHIDLENLREQPDPKIALQEVAQSIRLVFGKDAHKLLSLIETAKL